MNSFYTPTAPTAPTVTESYATESVFSRLAALGGIALLVIFVLAFFVGIIALIAYIFQGIGIMKMHKSLGLKRGWFAFLPVLNTYAFGKVAEQYIKENGKKSAKFSKHLLIGQILICLLSIPSSLILPTILTGDALALPRIVMIVLLIGSMLISLAEVVYGIIILIMYAVALWRIYAIFSKHPTLLFILSFFFLFIIPFVLFAIRNKEPKCVESAVFENIIEEVVVEA